MENFSKKRFGEEVSRRGLELLCLIEDDEVDWYDIDEVDADGLDVPPELSAQHGTPILGELDLIWRSDE